MTVADARLIRHLAIVVTLKLVVLGVLWWAFVRDDRVAIDVERAGAHLGARIGVPTGVIATPPPPTGAKP